MTRKVLILVVVTMFCSCKQGNKMPERKSLSVTAVVADNLFTSFPGTLQVNSKHLLLHCPRGDGGLNFLMVYDRESGEQLTRTGSIGRGPGEWTTPSIANVIADKLVVYDLNVRQYVIADADNMYQDISNPNSIKKVDIDISKMIYVDNSRSIVASWKEKHQFEMVSKKGLISCGKYPFEENITNTYERFQGIIEMHPQKNILIYATISNPYLAMYSIGDDRLDLTWENQFQSPDYTVYNQQLNWGSNQPNGVSDVALTKDYIVCLVKDFKNEARGMDVRTTPKAVYLFDYKGHLTHILDLPYHTIRLAADAQSNTFYAVSLEPDYCIVKYDLTTIGL
jgi:hypothetical protein